MKVAVCNTKGGVGKSTLLVNLAVWLYDHGIRVTVVDADSQATSVQTLQDVAPEIAAENVTELEQIAAAAKRLERSHDIVLIDTPPQRGGAVTAVCVVADMVIIPMQPSKKDLMATGSVLKLIRAAKRRRREAATTRQTRSQSCYPRSKARRCRT